ncbi:mixed lineage kinase domain-like protein [Glandiceps talaboti]
MALDTVGKILCIAIEIYKIAEEVQAQKHRSKRLCERIKALEPIVKKVRQFKTDEDGITYQEALQQLVLCLEDARDFLCKFRKQNMFVRVLKRGHIRSDFDDLNSTLDGLVPKLSLGLGVDMKATLDKIFNQHRQICEDREDEKKDWKEFQTILIDLKEGQQRVAEEVDSGFESVKGQLADVHEDVREVQEQLKCLIIQPRVSVVRQPVEDLVQIDSSELKFSGEIGQGRYGVVYKARRRADIVAVKKFTPKGGCSRVMLRDLKREAENMKKLNSTNVLRLFGICTEEDNYLLITEFMANRNLRYVLDNPEKYKLSWEERIRMSFEGASGIMYIHNAKPPMLHRCITSDKFLVDRFMQVKTAGSS